MAVTFRILPRQHLIYLRYSGVMAATDNAEVYGRLLAHPDFRKGMRALVDLTELVDWEPDYVAMMKYSALEAEAHDDPLHPTLLVCLAPDDLTKRIARAVNRSWEGSGRKVNVIVDTEPEALAVLGVGATSIAELLQEA